MTVHDPEPPDVDPDPWIAWVKGGLNAPRVGMAIVLDRHHVVTCAHVVNDALGRDDQDDISRPGKESWLALEVPGDPGRPHVATVAVWRPHDQDRWYTLRDVAILEVPSALPDAVRRPSLVRGPLSGIVQLVGPRRVEDEYFEAHLEGRIRRQAQPDLLQVDLSREAALSIDHGFSGGPVWRDDSREVVGMVVGTVTEGDEASPPGVVYVISANELRAAEAELHEEPDLGRGTDPEPEPATDLGRRTEPEPIPEPEPTPIPEHPGRPPIGPEVVAAVRRWALHPLLLAASFVTLPLGFLVSASIVGPGRGVLYGIATALVVQLFGVAAGVRISHVASSTQQESGETSSVTEQAALQG
jgi:hypothetical protein